MSKGRNKFSFYADDSNYLTSLSDMMSGLIFIFIITLMVFIFNYTNQKNIAEQSEKELRQKNIKLQEATLELEAQKEIQRRINDQLTDAREVRSQLLRDLKQSLQKDGVRVEIDTDNGILHVPQDVLFPSGSATLDDQGHKSLEILSRHLSQQLPCYHGKYGQPPPDTCPPSKYKPGRLEAVFVEGHTDNMPIRGGPFADNWELSAMRSLAAYREMIKDAPLLKNLKNAHGLPLFGVSGYGESRPRIPHSKETSEPKNRRIDLRFLLAPVDLEDVMVQRR